MASSSKPLVWKRFIDGIFSLLDISMKREVYNFVDFANKFHPIQSKFTCEMSSERSAVFLILRFSKDLAFQLIKFFTVANTFQAHRNFSIYTLLILQPFKLQKEFYKRRSIASFKNYLS